MTLRLCGVNISLEECMSNRVAAVRIHETANHMRSNFSSMDPQDIATSLKMTGEDILGILQAIDQGEPKDLEGRLIDKRSVEQELEVLIKDIETINQPVISILAASSGQLAWNQGIISLWGSSTVSLPLTCQELEQSAQQMRNRIISIVEERQQYLAIFQAFVPLPLVLNALIVEYLG